MRKTLFLGLALIIGLGMLFAFCGPEAPEEEEGGGSGTTTTSSTTSSSSSSSSSSSTTSSSSTSSSSSTTVTCGLPTGASDDSPGFTTDLTDYPDPTANSAWPLDNLRSYVLGLTSGTELVSGTTIVGIVTWVSATDGQPQKWVIEDNTGGAIYIYGTPGFNVYRGNMVTITGDLYLSLFYDTPEINLGNSTITSSSVTSSSVATHYITVTSGNMSTYLAKDDNDHSVYVNNIFLVCGTYTGDSSTTSGCSTANPCYGIDLNGDNNTDIYVRIPTDNAPNSAGQYVRVIGLFAESYNNQMIYGAGGVSYPTYVDVH